MSSTENISSVLLNDNDTKNTAKGVNQSEKNKLKHEMYKKIHDGTLKEIKSICPTISSIENNLFTMEPKKTFISWRRLFAKKRYKSHISKRKVYVLDEEIPLNFAYKRLLNLLK